MTETIRYTQTETGKPSKPSNHLDFSGDCANGDAIGSGRRQISIEDLLVWTYRHHHAHAIAGGRQSLNDSAPRVAALAISAMSNKTRTVSGIYGASSIDPLPGDTSSVPGNQFTDRAEVMPHDARIVHGVVMTLPEDTVRSSDPRLPPMRYRNRVMLQAARGERPSDGSDIPDHEWVPVYSREGKRVGWHSGEFEEVDDPPQGLKPGEGYWLLVPQPPSHRIGWLVRRAKPMPWERVTLSKRRRYWAVRYVDRSSRVAAAKHRYKLWCEALAAIHWFVAPLLVAHELTDALPSTTAQAIELY